MKNQVRVLVKKWLKVKAKLDKISAKEKNIRQQLGDLLAIHDFKKVTITVDGQKISLTRNERWSISKNDVLELKDELPQDIFNECFNSSYSIKKTAVDSVPEEYAATIKEHVTVKDSPLSVRVKDL